MTYRACIVLAALLEACSHDTPSSPSSSPPASSAAAPTGPAPSASSAAPAVSAAAAPANQPRAAMAEPDALLRVLARMKAWNQALDSHDVSALEGLYFEHVCYYGKVVRIDTVLRQKKDALGPRSSFRQQIVGGVNVERAADDVFVARFTKHSGIAQRLRDTAARIVLRSDPDDGELRILEEADDGGAAPDATSVACAEDAWSEAVEARCEAAASRAVQAMPRVKRIVDELLEASTDDHALGGMGPEDNGDGTWSASIGVHTNDRYEGRIDYTIDRKTGRLTVSVDGTDVPVPEGARREVARACER